MDAIMSHHHHHKIIILLMGKTLSFSSLQQQCLFTVWQWLSVTFWCSSALKWQSTAHARYFLLVY